MNAPTSSNSFKSEPANAPAGADRPHDTQAEAALLGAILLRNGTLRAVQEHVTAESFHEPVHGQIFTVIEQLIGAGRIADPATLRASFADHPQLKEVGVSAYLQGIVAAVEGDPDATSMALLVRDYAARRDVILEARRAIDEASEASHTAKPWAEIARDAKARMEAIAKRGNASRIRTGAEVLNAVLTKIENPITPISTGFKLLNESMGGGIYPEGIYAIEGAAKRFKALARDEAVLMADGTSRPIGNLRIGDRLASCDGRPSRVAGVYPQGVRPMFKFTLSDGRTVRCDAEHQWSIIKGRNPSKTSNHVVATTSEIRSMLARGVRITLPRPSGHFGGCELQVEPYLLGVLLGDGSITRGTVRYTNPDEEILDLVMRAAGDGFAAKTVGECERYLSYRDAGNPILDGLRDLGLMGCRSYEKFIPDVYFQSSREDRLGLLQGLLDTDSQAREGRAVFITTSPQLALDVRRLAWSLGMIAKAAKPTGSRYTYKGETRQGRTVYRVSIRADHPQELFRCSRKRRDALQMRKKGINLRVLSVEPDGSDEAVCITVTHPDSLYMTKDYVLTHNSGMLAAIFSGAVVQGKKAMFLSLEMTAEKILQRQIAGFHGMTYRALENQTYQAQNMKRVFQYANANPNMSQFGLFCHHPGITDSEVLALCGLAVERYGVELIIIDYWQLIGGKKSSETAAAHQERTIYALANFANDNRLPMVVASQLNYDGNSLGSGGMTRACIWRGIVNKVELPATTHMGHPSAGIWLEVPQSRDGPDGNIGSEDVPAFMIAPGPVLKEFR